MISGVYKTSFTVPAPYSIAVDGFDFLKSNEYLSAPYVPSSNFYSWHLNGLSSYSSVVPNWIGGEDLTENSPGCITQAIDHLANNRYCYFDGVSALAYINNANWDTYAGDISIGAWINPSAVTGSNRYIVDKSNCFYLRINTAGKLEFSIKSGSVLYTVDSGIPISASAYIYIYAVLDLVSKTLTLKINGKTVGTTTNVAISTLDIDTSRIFVGGQSGPINLYTGTICELQIYRGTMIEYDIRKTMSRGARTVSSEDSNGDIIIPKYDRLMDNFTSNYLTYADYIYEYTLNNGVNVDGALIKDSEITLGNTGLIIGTERPFSNAAGVLTLQNIDAIDATTEATIESAIDTLVNLTSIQSQSVSILNSLTVEAASPSLINQDLTSDSSSAQFGTLTLTTKLSTAAIDCNVVNGTINIMAPSSMGTTGSYKDFSAFVGSIIGNAIYMSADMSTVTTLIGSGSYSKSVAGSSGTVMGMRSFASSGTGTTSLDEIYGEYSTASMIAGNTTNVYGSIGELSIDVTYGSVSGYGVGLMGIYADSKGIYSATNYTAAIMGVIKDIDTASPDGAIVALLEGDSVRTSSNTVKSAFKVIDRTTTVGVGFEYGLDLYHSKNSESNVFLNADIRFSNQAILWNDASGELLCTAAIKNNAADMKIITTGSGDVELNPISTLVRIMGDTGNSTGSKSILYGSDGTGVDGDLSCGVRSNAGVFEYKDRSGNWTPLTSSGNANQSLSNLSSVSINANLGLLGNNTYSLGTDLKEMATIWTHTISHGSTLIPDLTISTSSDDGDIVLTPHGTGAVLIAQAYSSTTTEAPNMYIDSTGKMYRNANPKNIKLLEISIDYVITDTDGYGLIVAQNGNKITLPTPGDNIGRIIIVKRDCVTSVTVERDNVSDTIDGVASDYSIEFDKDAMWFCATAANKWIII